MNRSWPEGTVRAVLNTDLVTAPTAAALRARLASPPEFDFVLDAEGCALLAAVCDRLVPQPDRAVPIDIAGIVHSKLAADLGNGWRFDSMPPDTVAMAQGLRGIEASAQAGFGRGFAALGDAERDAVLVAVQVGDVADWPIDPTRFFEELLAGVAEAYYSHPIAQEEIGYLGMADAHGWVDVGFGASAPHEPLER